jgi:hypothetical protein
VLNAVLHAAHRVQVATKGTERPASDLEASRCL